MKLLVLFTGTVMVVQIINFIANQLLPQTEIHFSTLIAQFSSSFDMIFAYFSYIFRES